MTVVAAEEAGEREERLVPRNTEADDEGGTAWVVNTLLLMTKSRRRDALGDRCLRTSKPSAQPVEGGVHVAGVYSTKAGRSGRGS